MGLFITLLAVVLVVLGLFGFILTLIDAVKLRKLRRRYDETKDLSKQGELIRGSKGRETGYRGFGATNKGFKETGINPTGFNKPEGREFLPSTNPKPPRENNHSFRVSREFAY